MMNTNNFSKLYKSLWTTDKLNKNERDVYITLRLYLPYGADYGVVYPSIATITEESKVSEPIVKKCIKSLIAKGFIAKQANRGYNNTYVIKDLAEVLKDEESDVVPEKEEKKKPTFKENITKWAKDKAKKKANGELKADSDNNISMEQVKEKLHFDDVAKETSLEDATMLFNIIHSALNKERIKCKAILELTKDEIIYTLKKFKKANVKSSAYGYILTMLNNAKVQYQAYLLSCSGAHTDTTTMPTTTAAKNDTIIPADSTKTNMPTCEKHINTKNSFNNFEQRSYDYDAIFEAMQQEQRKYNYDALFA